MIQFRHKVNPVRECSFGGRNISVASGLVELLFSLKDVGG